jgi:hypothetical protein
MIHSKVVCCDSDMSELPFFFLADNYVHTLARLAFYFF